MDKQIFILNGTARAGKDTFAGLLYKYVSVRHISSITPVKEAAKALGCNDVKTDEYRNFLCELKKFVNSQGDFIWSYLDKQVEEFRVSDKIQVLLIDIREPEEIAKAVQRYKAKTILINRCDKLYDNFDIPRNTADLSVKNYKYDYVIPNINMKQFDYVVKLFCENIIKKRGLPLNGKVIAVDFDNTIAETEYPKIIKPIPETIKFLRECKEQGATIILWTCRGGKCLDEAVQWCVEHNVPIDYVNENAPSKIKFWGNDCRKVAADLYIDDKSLDPDYLDDVFADLIVERLCNEVFELTGGV